MLEVTGGSTSTTFASSDQDFPTLYAASELSRQNMARMEQLVEEGRRDHEPLRCAAQGAGGGAGSWLCGPGGGPGPCCLPSLSGGRCQSNILSCPPPRLAAEYATGYRTQTGVLLRKFFLLYWRNPNYSERPPGQPVGLPGQGARQEPARASPPMVQPCAHSVCVGSMATKHLHGTHSCSLDSPSVARRLCPLHHDGGKCVSHAFRAAAAWVAYQQGALAGLLLPPDMPPACCPWPAVAIILGLVYMGQVRRHASPQLRFTGVTPLHEAGLLCSCRACC
jgi:hypothetical protein